MRAPLDDEIAFEAQNPDLVGCAARRAATRSRLAPWIVISSDVQPRPDEKTPAGGCRTTGSTAANPNQAVAHHGISRRDREPRDP